MNVVQMICDYQCLTPFPLALELMTHSSSTKVAKCLYALCWMLHKYKERQCF